MSYKRFGILLDCSANGVPNVNMVKRLICVMEKMGYNFLELCMDDIYKIENEPYFGYLRGGYSNAELKEMDAFAKTHGVELIPCVQTLAHLTNLVKLPHYSGIVDIADILLIDEPRTYELIENMFKALRAGFTTNLVNIGFDEAHLVGLGRYLDKHGYVNRYDLLFKHLNRVLEIAAKYGFKAHIWSDMFFRLASKGQYYVKGLRLPKEVLEKVPENVDICYWDYGEHELTSEMFNEMFVQHKDFNRELWFAGGAWCWNGFAPHNLYSLASMKLAMEQVIAHKVENVMVTLWGGDGTECSYFATLPALYAIKQYAEGNFDEEKIKKGFYELFNIPFDTFMMLDLPSLTSRDPNGLKRESVSKTLLFNDCFLGWKDSAIEQVDRIPFADYAKKIRAAGNDAGEYAYVFDTIAALCEALELKGDLGVRTRKAYKTGDTATLKALTAEYEETAKRIEKFRRAFKKYWETDYKPYGWEVHQIRLGGLYTRVLDCKERLEDYLNGKVESIPELEEEILPYADWGLQYNRYRGLVSVSQL